MQFSSKNYTHHFRLITPEEMASTISNDKFSECWAQAETLEQFLAILKEDIEEMYTRHKYVLKYILSNGKNFTAYFTRF